MHKPKNMST